MNKYPFYKYQGTGNDFVMVDNRFGVFDTNDLALVRHFCDRRFGIGADGLIAIQPEKSHDFEMVYFNSDGSKSFCGNGSRCAVAFAFYLGMISKECRFLAIDGTHSGRVLEDGRISISVRDVQPTEIEADHHFIHTGSPHYIRYVKGLEDFPVVEEARKIRYNERFKTEGTNVNFVEELHDGIAVRTYERGVEDETLSCGSGVTACAISFALLKNLDHHCFIKTKGGDLEVSFQREQNNSFKNIMLTGPADFVFKGEIYA